MLPLTTVVLTRSDLEHSYDAHCARYVDAQYYCISGGVSEVDMLSSPLNYGTPSSVGSMRTPRSGVRGTPIRPRPDIGADRRVRQVS